MPPSNMYFCHDKYYCWCCYVCAFDAIDQKLKEAQESMALGKIGTEGEAKESLLQAKILLDELIERV